MKQFEIDNHLGELITLQGKAKNAKGYAVIFTKGKKVIYIKDLAEWPNELLNTKLTVKGTLKKIKLIPHPKIEEDGAISQGARGLQYVLLDYRLVKSS